MLKPVLISSIFLFCGVGDFLNQVSAATFHFPQELEPVQNFGRCVTPNRERALCIVLEECKYLYNLLTSTPLREADKLYLSRSQCGYQNGKVLICCPDRYRQAAPKAPPASTTPSPLSQDLLPHAGECGDVLSNRIYGGNVTKIDEYPWMALIEYLRPDGSKGHHCGGSLINQRYVITASHCVNGADIPSDWRLTGVRLGEWDTTTSPDCEVDVRGKSDCAPPHQDIPVEQAIPHPQYEPRSKNQVADIALLRLATPVTYTDFIKPVCLPVNVNLRSLSLDGIPMDVAGWGRTEHGGDSTVKLKATVEGKTLEECQKVYTSQEIILEKSQICAGGQEGIDSCRGDSGGPLVLLDTTNKVRYSFFLAGIVSFGPNPCGLNGWPGVYTKVADYIDFIQQTIKP